MKDEKIESKLENEDFSWVTSDQENVLDGIAEFFSKFKYKQIKNERFKDENYDSYLRFTHKLTRLVGQNGTPTPLYLYDRETNCDHPGCDCGISHTLIELRKMEIKENVDKYFEGNRCPHMLTRNMYVGICCPGHELLEISVGMYKPSVGKVSRIIADRNQSVDVRKDQAQDLVYKIRNAVWKGETK